MNAACCVFVKHKTHGSYEGKGRMSTGSNATHETNAIQPGGMGGGAWCGPEELRGMLQPLAALVPDPANVRLHSARNIEAIATSLRVFGQRVPIVCQRMPDGGLRVRAGNGRLTAAQSLGWSHMAAVVVDESDTTATAFAIADNRTAELAEWDSEALLDALNGLGADTAAVAGFDAADVQSLLAGIEGDAIPADEGADPADGLERFSVRLTRDQWATVRATLDSATRLGALDDSQNPDADGNALARVCEMWRG